MIAESYLRRRYQEGREEGREEGKVEGEEAALSAVEEAARQRGMSVEEIQGIIDETRAIIRRGRR